MTPPLDFQTIILRLQDFWAAHGCLIWQPYHTEVGAGTMNPATYLRVLGPEPWNVAYVEPSIRPDDGRYGENPNRLNQHTQFQVILKPDPGNPQELYLQSLEALGIDPRQHDIRFVEDNWESPALGAWGLGWEVWLDGLEITQFTYFQQAGGMVLDPPSVELTYGLERIAMALQGVRDFRDIRWDSVRTYGDIQLESEQEFSAYSFEVADVERLRTLYATYEAEARSALEHTLVLPAHDYVLKCSHTFNLLDTRGAVGVTERQALFSAMRGLARRVAEAYLAKREAAGFPWAAGNKVTSDGVTSSPSPRHPVTPSPQPLLVEIGTEELPASEVDSLLAQLRERFPALLDELRLEHGELRVLGTPRRLVLYAERLAPRQADLEQVVKGPPAARAFDAEGNPTRAALGFARGKGVAVEDLQIREMDGGRYAVAVVRREGRPAIEVLSEALPGLIASLRFRKAMRWNATNVAFSRPIRWLVALFGESVVPFEYAGYRSGAVTRGLRHPLGAQAAQIPVGSPRAYFGALESQGIVLDPAERRALIRSQAEKLAAEVGGQIPDDEALLAEVANLVEAPVGVRGSFEAEYLDLPREVLISVMRKHQRYFPLTPTPLAPLPLSRGERGGADRPGGGGEGLLPYFITICNGEKERLDLVRRGNEDVIRARFADAAFFIREDKRRPLEDCLPRLKTLTFQADLGSMLDKTERIAALVEALLPRMEMTPEEAQAARRAARLCKADLATSMVVEMTSLQGVMGRYYALHSGEPPAVAEAIFEHYLPRFAGDALPRSKPGLLVGLADRIDSLAGLFAVNMAPTGNKDPFALRRAALGLVSSLLAWNLDFDLRAALKAAAGVLPARFDADEQADCLTFIVERLRNLLLEKGYRYDVVDAVLVAQGHNPARAARAVEELSAWVERPDWSTILPAYARCVRITRDKDETYPVVPETFVEAAEHALYAALRQAQAARRRPGSVDDFMEAFLPMIPVINRFFEDVLVMAEDPAQRANRLGMLQAIASLAEGVADFSRLEGF
ncbi:MAG TPA: glycine--tRNA ligase subunit beta [Chloroflexi bacterium]|nr:glycine--tRNA ligase subunit beta [Chloroflexota bacterium]